MRRRSFPREPGLGEHALKSIVDLTERTSANCQIPQASPPRGLPLPGPISSTTRQRDLIARTSNTDCALCILESAVVLGRSKGHKSGVQRDGNRSRSLQGIPTVVSTADKCWRAAVPHEPPDDV